MTWIRERIVGQTGNPSDWQGQAQPPAALYQQRLMNTLPSILAAFPTQAQTMASGGGVDSVPAMLAPGEHVLTAADVAAMGGQGGVYAFRNALHRQEGGPINIAFNPTGPPPGPSALGPPQLQPPQPPPPPGGPPEPSPPTPEGTVSPGGPPLPPTGPTAPGVGPTKIGGAAFPEGYGPGFQITGGGLIGLAESLPATAIQYGISAAMAAAASSHHRGGEVLRMRHGGAVGHYQEGGAPAGAGAGGIGGDVSGSLIAAAINIGMQELNRAIGFGGQAAGILTSGLFETFLPAGASQLASNNWLVRWLGGIVGAHPALPNISGSASKATAEALTGQQNNIAYNPTGPLPGPPGGQNNIAFNPTGPAPGPQVNTGPQVNIQSYNVVPSNTLNDLVQTAHGVASWPSPTPGQR